MVELPFSELMCDVRHCTAPCFVKVDGLAHCWLHFEIMWERWNVPHDSIIRETYDDVVYRHSPLAEVQARDDAYRRCGRPQ